MNVTDSDLIDTGTYCQPSSPTATGEDTEITDAVAKLFVREKKLEKLARQTGYKLSYFGCLDGMHREIVFVFPAEETVFVGVVVDANTAPIYDLTLTKEDVLNMYRKLETKYRRFKRRQMAIGLASTGIVPHERLPVLVMCEIWTWLNAAGTSMEDDSRFVINEEIKRVRQFE